MINDFLDQLPEFYSKEETSNLYRIMLLYSKQLDEFKETAEKVERWRSIKYAQGKVLELLGDNVNQKRGMATDDIYRVMIRGKKAISLSTGTVDSIIKALSVSLDCDPTEINVQFGYEQEEPESAMINIKKAPLAALNKIGMTAGQFIQIVNKVVIGGVGVSLINLEGTFEFSSKPNEVEIDNENGFSDVEQTTGGFFGAVFSGASGINLPI